MRKTVKALFENPQELRAEDVAKSKVLKTLLKSQIPIAIEDAIVSKKIYASVFEINDTKNYVEVHKNHWTTALETCLIWYVEDEDYEMCTHIKNLIQSIQNKSSKKITIKKDGKGL